MIYITKLTNDKESILKLGYTGKDTTDCRYRQYKAKFTKVEHLYSWTDDERFCDLRRLEIDINNKYLTGRKVNTKTIFSGQNECYRLGDEQLLIDTVEYYKNTIKYIPKNLPEGYRLEYVESPRQKLGAIPYKISLNVYREGEDYPFPNNNNDVLCPWLALALYDQKEKLDHLLKDVDIDSLRKQSNNIDHVLGSYYGDTFMVMDEEEADLVSELTMEEVEEGIKRLMSED